VESGADYRADPGHVGHLGKRLHELAVAGTGRTHRVVVSRNANALIGTLEARERPDQPPCGVGEDRTTHTRVRIEGAALDRKLDGLALPQVERDAVDGAHLSRALTEHDGKITH
jgi:hypothetical protein